MKLGLKEAIRLKKDLGLDDMSEESFIVILKNYIKVEENERKAKNVTVYFHHTRMRNLFGFLAYRFENDCLKEMYENILNNLELTLTEPDLVYILKTIGDNEEFSELKNYLQLHGDNVFWRKL
jgi:hypothetical protein